MPHESLNVRAIFDRAVEITSDAERTAYLDEVCAEAADIRQQVDVLLHAHLVAGSFLQSPPPGLTGAADSPALSEQAGSLIGPYKLLEQIGEGGMGVVYMAEQQEPVRRKVALKLIKPGMDTRQVIARFEAERQALAVMDHPGIARVLDAGATPSGHPYFVMELVRGVPITTYCDENNLPVFERIELFASVCQAIQHAHTKGIIHRDIKPTNVLVTRQDGRAAVKVIDFGVAKAMGQQLTEKTLFTNFAQMIGTPLYMSPEQTEQSGIDIDTRSDIYSLGVLLYELLTGSTPVDAEQLKQAAFDEIRRIIREDEPLTPSARISGSHTLPSIAAHRHVEPARLSRQVRGELDWIVMKSLEKDRTRRYETANAFAADLLHYLHDEPVLACPPSAKYRLGKFARRNRAALITATMVAGALVLGTITSTWQAIRADTARDAEAEQRKIAEAALHAEAKQRGIAEAARTAEATQRQAAESQRSEAEKQRVAAEANYQKAKAAVDKYFTLVSESTLFEVPGLQPLRKDLLESALEFYEGAALERVNDPALLADVAATHLKVSSIYIALNRADDFIAAIRRALDVIDRLHREYPEGGDYEHKLAGFWKGTRWTRTGMDAPRNVVGAFQTMFRFEKTWQQFVERYPSVVAFQSDLGYGQSMVAAGFTVVGRLPEGTAYYRKALATSEQVVNQAPNDPHYRSGLAEILQNLARNMKLEGRQEAGKNNEALLYTRRAVQQREALVAEFPDHVAYRSELAGSLKAFAELAAKAEPQMAQESVRRAVELSESLFQEFPDNQPYVHLWVSALSLLSTLNRSPADASEAEAMTQQVTDAISEQIKLHPNNRHLRAELALYCFAAADEQADFAAVSEQLRRHGQETLESLIVDFPDETDYWKSHVAEKLGHNSRYLGWFTRDTGRSDEALQYFDKAAAVFEKLAIADIPQRDGFYRDFAADSLLQKVGILAATGRADDAEKTGRRVIEAYDSLSRAFPTAAASYRQKSLGAVQTLISNLADNGRRSQAESASRQAIEKYALLAEANPSEPDYPRFQAACQRKLAGIQAADDRWEEAAKTYREAIASYQKGIDEFPKYADLWRNYIGLAQALDASNQPVEADAARSKAIELAPRDAGTLNSYAWQYSNAVDLKERNARLAVALATKGAALAPQNAMVLNTLGVAHYRAGNWQEANDWLTKAMALRNGGDSFDWLFLSMANWQLGNKDIARDWLAKSVAWIEKSGSINANLKRFRAEAEGLLQDQSAAADPETEKKADGAPTP